MFYNNKIFIIDENGNRKRRFLPIKGLKIRFDGKNSIVEISKPIAKFKKSKIRLGNNCFVKIDSSQYKIIKMTALVTADNSTLIVGKNFSSENIGILLHYEPNKKITIGEDVMTANGVKLRSTDSHTIYDLNTKQALNYGNDVNIGNHVWIATDSIVQKGVNISDNIVIASHSVVTKNCTQSNTIYGGVPAKILKENINWDRNNPTLYNSLMEKM